MPNEILSSAECAISANYQQTQVEKEMEAKQFSGYQSNFFWSSTTQKSYSTWPQQPLKAKESIGI